MYTYTVDDYMVSGARGILVETDEPEELELLQNFIGRMLEELRHRTPRCDESGEQCSPECDAIHADDAIEAIVGEFDGVCWINDDMPASWEAISRFRPLPFRAVPQGNTRPSARHDCSPLSLMIRGVVSPGPKAPHDR